MIALLPAICLAVGGVLGSTIRPGRTLRGVTAHLVGGLVLGTAAADLMPAATSANNPLALGIGFCLGFSLLLGINTLVDQDKGAEAATPPMMLVLLIPFLIDSFIDGLVVGVSSTVGNNGWVISLAIALEMGLAALGLGTLLGRGSGRWRSALAGSSMAATYLVGLITSHVLGHMLEGASMTGLLAFGTAALIYLAVEEILKEAHRAGEDDSGIVNIALFIGILVVWLLDSSTSSTPA